MKKNQKSLRKVVSSSVARCSRRRTLRWALPELLEQRTLMSVTFNNVYTVTTNAPSGPGSLAAAISAVNADTTASVATPDQIAFALTGGTQIALTNALPAIINPVVVDGTTQSGYSGTPVVWLSAASSSAAAGGNGLTLAADGSGVQGLAITGFSGGAGVEMQGANDFVAQDYLGLDPSGGIFQQNLNGSETNEYGASADGPNAQVTNNVLSNNQYGLQITGNGATVTGNDIGTDPTGMQGRGNNDAGINVMGAGGVTIGGASPSLRNIISGNFNDGIDFTDPGAGDLVVGNFIGLDATGNTAVPISSSSPGNAGYGLYITASTAGATTGVVVGGTSAGDANVISANQAEGVEIYSASGNVVEGNLIGTDEAGQNAVANGGNGVQVESTSSNNTIGGSGPAGNLISGNMGDGVYFNTDPSTTGNVVAGNLIGTDISGTHALANEGVGVEVSDNVTIGTPGAGNVISGNTGDGVDLDGSGNVVEFNAIGAQANSSNAAALGNGSNGVTVYGAHNIIGANGSANTIAFNGRAGVAVGFGTNTSPAVGNSVEGNFIYANAGLGIDLGSNGVTANDSAGHAGPNHLQDYPVLGTLTTTATTVTVSGNLANAAPGTQYTIDLYNNPAADPSGHGQGQIFVGSEAVTIGTGGSFTASFTVGQLPSGSVWSATATDLSGNTSEFSADFVAAATVQKQDPTTNLTSSLNPATFGASVTFTATVTGSAGVASGTLSLYDGSTLIDSVTLNGTSAATLSFTTLSLSVASHSMSVSYSGDGNYNPASASLSEVVNTAATATNLSVNPATSLYGQNVTLTATVTPTLNGTMPTGTVNFYDGINLLGPGTLVNGVATLTVYTLGIGTHGLSAQYVGDSNFAGSTSNTVNESVDPQASTISGTVYNDLTGNGLTSDDTPLANVTVDLFQVVNGSNVLVNSLVTGGNGQYSFSTSSGTFFVQEVVPANSTETAGTAGYTLNATSGTVVPGANFDNFQNMSVSGTVYNDLTGNGITSDDTAEAGVTVHLLSGSSVVASTTSGSNGSYAFSNLGPGNYTVQEVVPSGSTQTAGAAGYSVSAQSGLNVTGDNFANFQPASISGAVYQDLTGNGFSSDDTLLSGVTVDLFENGGATLVATTVSTSNGTYSFTNLAPGSYFVQEVVPSGWIETGGLSGYTISATGGTASSGNNFDNFHDVCDLSKITCISYVINGCTRVTSLAGNTHEGDQVQVFFTLASGYTDTLSLVSYTAPDPTFVAADASKQVVFDSQSGTFTGGTHSLTITIPLCYYQIDFVCGPIIDHFGPAGSNVFYSPQGRKIDSDNSGIDACFNGGGELSGFVYDDLNKDKTDDGKDTGIAGVIVTLTGTDSSGHTVHLVRTTAADGSFYFMGLRAGTYTITETQPSGYTSDATDVGTVNGTTDGKAVNTAGGQIANIVLKLGADGVSYDFGEIKFGCY